MLCFCRLYGVDKAQTTSVPQRILSLIVVPDDQLLSDLSQIWAALVLLPHLRQELSAQTPVAVCSCVVRIYSNLNMVLQAAGSSERDSSSHRASEPTVT